MKTALPRRIAAFFIIFAALFAAAFAQKAADMGRPFVLGTIQEIQSAQLGEKRTQNIYLPDGYKASDPAKYPVIYLLDGGADEDFIHTVGLVQFNSFPWVNRLSPSIVVGITNVDRKRDFTFPTTIEADKKRYPTTGHSEKFIAFLEKELQPYIAKTYNVNGTRTLIGESLGGLLAAEILLKHLTLFDKYIIVSPSLWWDDGSLLRYPLTSFAASVDKRTDVYIGVGKEGLAWSDTPHVGEVDANVLADKLRTSKAAGLTVYFDYLPQEDHATISHQAVLNAFRLLGTADKR